MRLYFLQPLERREVFLGILVRTYYLVACDELHTILYALFHDNVRLKYADVWSTGGAYDTVPEVCILLGLFNHSDKFFPVVFDEAGKDMLSSSKALFELMVRQVTESPLSIFSLPWKAHSHLSIYSTIVKPTQSFPATLNWV
jgi:hypothetical protein